MEKTINFIESPDELSMMDMDLIVGGTSSAGGACINCSGSSCNVKDVLSQDQLLAE